MEPILQLKITLRNAKPPIWRRVLVEKHITFHELHYVIQGAMGWMNCHLHEFTVDGIRIGQPFEDFDADFGDDLVDSDTVTLESMLSGIGQKFDYVYDFGDNWEHRLVVEKWLPRDEKLTYPACTAGKLNCPPEDCGGIYGYYNMLSILADKKHPERREMLEWLGGPFDALAFDKDEVNQQWTGND